MKEKIIKTSKDGLETITLLDDAGNEGMSITMESIFEARELEELDATNILNDQQITELAEPAKPKNRLELNNITLTHKQTGEILTGKGSIPSLEQRKSLDYSGTFLLLKNQQGENVSILIPFNKAGEIAPSFPYTIEETKINERI